jgi:hypothetical protein
MFARLGLTIHSTKCDFAGSRTLDIIETLVDTSRALFHRSPEKLHKVEGAAKRILAHARSNCRHVPAHALRSFAGLGNSTGLAFVDAQLRLREVFSALALVASRQEEENGRSERVKGSAASAHLAESSPFIRNQPAPRRSAAGGRATGPKFSRFCLSSLSPPTLRPATQSAPNQSRRDQRSAFVGNSQQ